MESPSAYIKNISSDFSFIARNQSTVEMEPQKTMLIGEMKIVDLMICVTATPNCGLHASEAQNKHFSLINIILLFCLKANTAIIITIIIIEIIDTPSEILIAMSNLILKTMIMQK